MGRPRSKQPTELELEILKVLWSTGDSTVRQIQAALLPARDLAYTTVMTMLVIMTSKGLVRRRKSGTSNVYTAAIEQGTASTGMLQDLVDRVFGGSVTAVVQHLIETSDLDSEELKAIRQLVHRKQKEHKS